MQPGRSEYGADFFQAAEIGAIFKKFKHKAQMAQFIQIQP